MFIVEETIAGADAVQIPTQRGESLLETAVRYAEERHWDVVPGTWTEVVDGMHACSCGDAACSAPGAHPAGPDWADRATGSAGAARRMWQQRPGASILLPTGRAFDAISVPETAGLLALARMERMSLTPGPVTRTPHRRTEFFVLPGAAAKLPDLLRALGWTASSLDLAVLGEGAYVTAPPTRVGRHGAVQWVRRPTQENRWLPDAEELAPALAYACGQNR
ncbi:bifunctional DNA primase/polymerase [Streptomyces sp. MA15]|uniref:bifunctional DNA primase/polymerase n=1 Tax=Streptomyces sp. MA15 TaxID=3055061 RepID=UPI0025B265B3|nr:bifunctional DNA primase/polymerase [Streptomyces sp. MA15]MDN3266179.1 bifunctional DNA primase/polymerase [Streptomyces sp. MA15]